MFSFSMKKSPFLRLFLVSLIILIVFNTTFNTKKVNGTVLVAGLTVAEVCMIIGACVGVVGAGTEIYKLVKESKGGSDEEALQTCNECISVNGDGNYVITGELLQYCQQAHEKAEDAGYTYFYYPSAQYLNPDFFQYKDVYNFVKNTIVDNPDWYFKVYQEDWNYRLLGTKVEPLGVVASTSSWGANSLRANMYNTDWTQNFVNNSDGEYLALEISSNIPYGARDEPSIRYCRGVNESGSWVWSDEIDASTKGVDMDSYLGDTVLEEGDPAFRTSSQAGASGNYIMDCTWYSTYGIERAWVESTGPALAAQGGALYHGASGLNTIEVYPTLNALKKGTIGITRTQITSDYDPDGVLEQVTPQQVTNYTNITDSYNDTNTGNDDDDSGDDDSGDDDSGSGSGWLDKIIDGLGSIGDALLNIVGVILEWVGKAIDFVTDTLDDVIELVTGNKFIEVLTAFFPFVPEEVWTGISLLLGMLLFASIINFLRK